MWYTRSKALSIKEYGWDDIVGQCLVKLLRYPMFVSKKEKNEEWDAKYPRRDCHIHKTVIQVWNGMLQTFKLS